MRNIDNDKYYIVKGIYLANALSFVTGQKPYVFQDSYNKNMKVFSFVKDEKLNKALTELNKLRNELQE